MGNPIIDSGSTLFTGPAAIVNKMIDYVKKYCEIGEGRCDGAVYEEKFSYPRCWYWDSKKYPNI